MSDGPTNPLPASLVNRVVNILTKPGEEWAKIENEPATVQGIYTSYVLILAAIPAVASLLGLLLFMPRTPDVAVALGQALGVPVVTTGSIIVGAVIQYALSLGAVYVLGLIIDALAPTFGATKDALKSFKLAAYTPTAAWIAGILALLPQIAVVGMLLGLGYSLYLLYVGLPILTKVSKENHLTYFLVLIFATIVVFGLANVIASKIMWGGLF